MKNAFRYASLGLLAAVVALCSCSREKSGDVLASVGSLATTAICADLEAFMASAGATSIDQLPELPVGSNTRGLNALKKLKGLDLNSVLAVQYPFLDKPAIVASVKDRGQLEASLSAISLDKSDVDGFAVYPPKDGSLYCVVASGSLYIVDAKGSGLAAGLVGKMLEEAEEPLDGWKAESLAAEGALDGFVVNADRAYTFDLKLEGPKAGLVVDSRDAAGKPSPWLPEGSYSHITQGISTHSLFSFSLAKADYATLVAELNSALRLGVSSKDLGRLASLTGPMWGTVDFSGRSIVDLGKYAADLNIQTSSPEAARELLEEAVGELRGMFLPVKSAGDGAYTMSFDELTLNARAEGNMLRIVTEKPVTEPDQGWHDTDCVAWVATCFPRSLVALLTDDDSMGIKAQLKVRDSSIWIEMEFTDTETPFLENLKTVLKL